MATVSPTLELVVRQALEDEVRRLVDALAPEVAAAVVAERLNGARDDILTPAAEAMRSDRAEGMRSDRAEVFPRDTKVCTRCGETKDTSGFEPGRAQCRDCRRRDERERAARRRQNGTPEVAAVPFEQV